MKKLTILFASLIITLASYAQNNLFEELAKYEGEKFYKYELEYNSDNGKLLTSADEDVFDVVVTRDSYGTPIGITMNTDNVHDISKHTYDPRYDRIDHYTNPAFCRHNNTTSTFKHEMSYVMVDGLLYAFIPTKEDMSLFGGKYDYGYVFVPESIVEGPVSEAPEEKKKFGSKVKGFLSAMKTPAFFDHIPSTEALDGIINTYMDAMRKKQADNPLSAQDQSRWQEVIDSKQAAWDDLNAYNDAYWQSEEGQRVLALRNQGQNKCTFSIKNTGNQDVYVKEAGSLNADRILPNSTKEYSCDYPIHYSNSDREQFGFIAGGGSSYSGQTIPVN